MSAALTALASVSDATAPESDTALTVAAIPPTDTEKSAAAGVDAASSD